MRIAVLSDVHGNPIAELRASTYPSRSWLIKVHQRAESVRPLELDTTAADGRAR